MPGRWRWWRSAAPLPWGNWGARLMRIERAPLRAGVAPPDLIGSLARFTPSWGGGSEGHTEDFPLARSSWLRATGGQAPSRPRQVPGAGAGLVKSASPGRNDGWAFSLQTMLYERNVTMTKNPFWVFFTPKRDRTDGPSTCRGQHPAGKAPSPRELLRWWPGGQARLLSPGTPVPRKRLPVANHLRPTFPGSCTQHLPGRTGAPGAAGLLPEASP